MPPRSPTSSASSPRSAATTTRPWTGTAKPWPSTRNSATAPARPAPTTQERGDYDQALDWYRQSLTIKEELGNRAGTASSYHQLGIIAQERGDYDQALDWYRQSLAIKEELGNRAGTASTISQLGVLATETGAPAEGVGWNLRSLGIRLQIGSPEARIDLHWLVRQRELLGIQPFEQLDEESANAVLDLLERWTARGTADPGGTDPAPG